MSKKGVATDANGVRPGDVRTINGIRALVVRDDNNGMFLCVPLKKMSDCPTSSIVTIELDRKASKLDFIEYIDALAADEWSGAADALIRFGAGIYGNLIGGLLYRIDPATNRRVEEAYLSSIREGREGETKYCDFVADNSREDWELYHSMASESMERFVSFEADTHVLDNGTWRRETKEERRRRLARRRYYMKKKGVWHKKGA